MIVCRKLFVANENYIARSENTAHRFCKVPEDRQKVASSPAEVISAGVISTHDEVSESLVFCCRGQTSPRSLTTDVQKEVLANAKCMHSRRRGQNKQFRIDLAYRLDF